MRTKYRLARAEDRIAQLIEDIRVLREGLSAAGVCRMPGITTADRWVRADSAEWREHLTHLEVQRQWLSRMAGLGAMPFGLP